MDIGMNGPEIAAPGPRRFVLIAFPDDAASAMQIQLSDGLAFDVAARMCYGATMFLERELTARRVVAVLTDTPRVHIPGAPVGPITRHEG